MLDQKNVVIELLTQRETIKSSEDGGKCWMIRNTESIIDDETVLARLDLIDHKDKKH